MPNGRTRSGAQFSPYDFGPALTAPPSFRTDEFLARLGEQDFDAASDHDEAFSDSEDAESGAIFDAKTSTGASSPLPIASTPQSAPAPATDAVAPLLTHNQRSRDKKKAKRNVKRAAAQVAANTNLKAVAQRRRKEAAANALDAGASFRDGFDDVLTDPVWVAMRDKGEEGIEAREYELDELLDDFDMREIYWDGRTARPLKDRNNTVCGVLGGIPRDPKWDEIKERATRSIEAAEAVLHFPANATLHSRGAFPALAAGISYGGGQTQPTVRRHTPHNAPIVRELLHSSAFRSISGFSNCLFEAYAPRLHHYYSGVVSAVEKRDHSLARAIPRSAFAACTVNFGPNTVTYPHRDAANLTWGWCAITALGNYNANHGGHLVLWDLNCIVRFPSGSTILIPSALIRHSNVSISQGETRYSVAQYSAGALFRWVDAGFKPEPKFSNSAAAQAQRKEAGERRWAMGMGMLSTVQEFL